MNTWMYTRLNLRIREPFGWTMQSWNEDTRVSWDMRKGANVKTLSGEIWVSNFLSIIPYFSHISYKSCLVRDNKHFKFKMEYDRPCHLCSPRRKDWKIFLYLYLTIWNIWSCVKQLDHIELYNKSKELKEKNYSLISKKI